MPSMQDRVDSNVQLPVAFGRQPAVRYGPGAPEIPPAKTLLDLMTAQFERVRSQVECELVAARSRFLISLLSPLQSVPCVRCIAAQRSVADLPHGWQVGCARSAEPDKRLERGITFVQGSLRHSLRPRHLLF